MSRYTRAVIRADWFSDDAPLCPALYVDDNVTIDTGLVWADGETIWREPNPLGFGRDGEW